MAIWKILRPFLIFYGNLAYFVVICHKYYFGFDELYQEKSEAGRRDS
jgi:hypothetical protein